jgi:VIT1/CCC1 family predicted Fe2+/Mn2+ transporter
VASALTFSSGAIIPILVMWLSPRDLTYWTVFGTALVLLALLGALGAWAGGANRIKGVIRVSLWGAFAMAVTGGVGRIFGAVG